MNLELEFINKKYPKKHIFCYIKGDVSIYNLKKRLLMFFAIKVKKTVTDFRLVREGPPEDDKNDTIKDNYFDEKYNDQDAYTLMQKIQDKKKVYFRTIQLTISVTIFTKSGTLKLELPLAFENSYQQLLNNIEEKLKIQINDQPHHVFQNTDKLETISEEEDMKKYQKSGLIIYLYPILVKYINIDTRDEVDVLMKYDKPFTYYLQEGILNKLKIKSMAPSLTIRKDKTSINLNQPIHEIMKKQTEEPIIIEIKDNKSTPIKKSTKTQNFVFQTKNGKFLAESFSLSMTIGDALKELRNKSRNIEENSFLIFMGQVVDNNSTFSNIVGNKKDDDDEEEPFIVETKVPTQITVELKFQIGKNRTQRNGKFKFIKGTEIYNVHRLASIISEQEIDSITLEANYENLDDEDTLENDILIIADLSDVPGVSKNAQKVQEILSKAQDNIIAREENRTKEGSPNNEDSKPKLFQNDYIKPSTKDPENEYVYKFKTFGIEKHEFELSLPKNVIGIDVKEAIAKHENTKPENITIFLGNRRLADYNKLANLTTPHKVSFFSVKIINLVDSLILSDKRLA